jgi:N-acetylglucosamine malate deacetylase 1
VTVPGMTTFSGRLVVVAPHMDDESLGCGLLLATHADKSQAHVVFVTDGAQSPEGARRTAVEAHDLARTRQQEALAALAVLGVPTGNVEFLGLPDGSLHGRGPQLQATLAALVQRLQPRHVFVPFRYDRHPDHLAVNRAVCTAQRDGTIDAEIFEYFVYTQWRLLRTGDVRDYIASDALHRVEAGAAAAVKRRALECHRSQTTRFFPWQARPVLTPELLDRVCREPESFLKFDPTRVGRRVLTRGRAWIPVAHRVEPVLKRWKDRISGQAAA